MGQDETVKPFDAYDEPSPLREVKLMSNVLKRLPTPKANKVLNLQIEVN